MLGNSKKVTQKELAEAVQKSVSSDSQLVVLEPKDYNEMTDVFAEAFLEDPLATFVAGLSGRSLDENKKKELQLKCNVMMNAWINRPVLIRNKGVAFGIQDQTSGSLAGVMTLVANGSKTEAFFDILTTVIACGLPPFYTKEKENYGAHADKRLECLNALPKKKKKWMKDIKRYIYIQSLGVTSEHRGKGFGGKMLRTILGVADKMGVCLYLETESESNEALYHHFGFETLETIVLQGKNDSTNAKLTMWLMLRRPKATRA
mmetsp:Transcript_13848/g.20432  ORF Transcript_13848/g.20432 Transcript_13848/m.20432 type:complete len:261 (+) Transcript_13848:81-863(+)|eukprot:CAMPEP_0194204064 /NCGR_PEP_ID=MMETSP0156-20130528/3688_1 /TAXON_ID=33649 /ORGANISM="Thalassionema nitzschioides, Strain L26-B" /LENGTH=260 /DNA_ID=CAMNT_0038929979 /DNA_START=84 /DNA_END=866 /DNA_ORIENTATION=-